MRSTRIVVRVPTGLGMGMLIGKQGSNIKYLQSRTAARMAVNAIYETVTITGSQEDVSLALALLEAQFASWRSSDEVTRATNHTESLYRLQSKTSGLAPRFHSSTRSTCGADCAMLAFASLSLHKATQFHTTNGSSDVLDGMNAALRTVACATPKLAELKVTLNFGTQFFYAGKGMPAPDQYRDLSINKLNQIELSGREAVLKSVFSNGTSSTQLERIRQYISTKLGFAKVAIKATASVHVKNKDLNTSLVVAFNRSGDKLSLRKVKSGALKPFFLTFVDEPPGQDVRLKLMGQRHFAENGPEMRGLANIITGSILRQGHLYIPCLSSQEVDMTRIKTKEIYEGMWKGQLIRLAFNTIQVESGEEHCEVTGRMPHLNDLLQAALVAKADLAELMAESRTSLQNLADFCTTVARTA